MRPRAYPRSELAVAGRLGEFGLHPLDAVDLLLGVPGEVRQAVDVIHPGQDSDGHQWHGMLTRVLRGFTSWIERVLPVVVPVTKSVTDPADFPDEQVDRIVGPLEARPVSK